MVLMIEATWTFEESAKIGKELRRQADRWVFVFCMVHERVRYYNITETRAPESGKSDAKRLFAAKRFLTGRSRSRQK